ncbi:MAG: ribulokinase [Clostridiales bacterium]|nr:ribulokinase [Clostridiales bacterium]
MAGKYSIGVDFGTLSGRAVLVNLDTGSEEAVSVKNYTHGVMDEYLMDTKIKLGQDWALQYPMDYIEVFRYTIPDILKQANVLPENVIGIGIDFTACTMLPVKADGTPLCMTDEFINEPHSYVKLWKHHAAQPQANRLNKIAEERGESFLDLYGGKISSEWLVPKIMQIYEEAPMVYRKADRFMEAADWVVMCLTGIETRNSCTAGYKGLWNKKKGYPSKAFYKALSPGLENLVEEKLPVKISPIGSKAGEINEYGSEITGLRKGTAVAVGNVDAHVAAPAVGITEPGKMLMIMGTSTCHMLLGTEEKIVAGMCGVVEDGIIPGYLGYEAGQSCVGDHFQWFVDNCLPFSYYEEAKVQNINVHKFLRGKASRLKPGESGLIALDWWNGNRSVLVDVDLTGMLLGLTLQTKPEEIYRTLIEATAYGTKKIIETFKKAGVPVNELTAAGGIAEKDEMMMQIYSDVTDMEIKISASPQAPALGSAMFGAVAAGKDKGGFDNIMEASKVMSKIKDYIYKPIPENVKIYSELYKEYEILHDYFGCGSNDAMKRLKDIKKRVRCPLFPFESF